MEPLSTNRDKSPTVNTYRILYSGSKRDVQFVKAESVHRFKQTCDTYTFKVGEEIVAEIPKAEVLSIEKTNSESDD